MKDEIGPPLRFDKPFTQQEPIPELAIEAAVRVLRSGRLHRYNTLTPDAVSETAALEQEYAALQRCAYCIACASGGYAMQLSMRAAGVMHGDPVLTNAFTLSPVPGAIHALGGRPVLVETTDQLVIDLEDLADKQRTSGARFLLLSHMRGHLADLHAIVRFCDATGVTLIEDCAHTMGASFDGTPSGNHGALACFSTQTYKHVNSGEGGLITTDDPQLAARLILMSGSYMLYERHLARPDTAVIESLRGQMPNLSGRMDELRAAILRPQLALLGGNIERWNALHDRLTESLGDIAEVSLPRPHPHAHEVHSSFQLRLPGRDADSMRTLVARCAARGVELKWFGDSVARGYTSQYTHWHYAASDPCPTTDRVLSTLLDLRLPLSFVPEDADTMATILREELALTAA